MKNWLKAVGAADWPMDVNWVDIGRSLGQTRTLDPHASRLRRKLNANGECSYVLNVWGVGYRLVAGVS